MAGYSLDGKYNLAFPKGGRNITPYFVGMGDTYGCET